MSYVFFFTLAYPCSGALDLGEFTQWCGNHWNKPHLDACRSLLQSKSSSPSPLPFPCLYTLLFLNAATMCNVQKPSLSSTTKYYIALPHSILCIFTLLFLLQSRSGLPSYARIRSIAQWDLFYHYLPPLQQSRGQWEGNGTCTSTPRGWWFTRTNRLHN